MTAPQTAEQQFAALNVIGHNRAKVKPLHDEQLVAVHRLPADAVIVVYKADLTGPGHDPHVRMVELTANKWEDTVLSHCVTKETVTPMPNGRERPSSALSSVLHMPAVIFA